MLVAPVRSFGYPPAQVKNAAEDEDRQKSFDRWRNRIRFKVHDDGFAEDIRETALSDSVEIRKNSSGELEMRMPRSRLTQQSFRRVKARRRGTAGAKPVCTATAAAPDVCRRAARNKELSDHRVQIGRRRLGFPVVGKGVRIAIVSTQRCLIHPAAPSLSNHHRSF